jgi:thymidylate synthase ThyX
MYDVKIIADSIGDNGIRIITVQARYWRAIHAELMTHRVFSRNASSSRAIPVLTMLKQVWNDPAGPLHWGQNRPGMQAHEELPGWRKRAAQMLWRGAAKTACVFAWSLMKLGAHKQVANRILEPFQYISVIITATDWDNFFELRDHKDAQPEIQHLARLIRTAMDASKPQWLAVNQWHLPYITRAERNTNPLDMLLKASVARCARVSYLTHDGDAPSLKKDVALHDRLVVAKPIHASPAEHQAVALRTDVRCRNFRGWNQYRDQLECPF